MTVRYSTKPYGRYLQSYYTDEVTQQGDHFVVSNVSYRKDGDTLTEINRHSTKPEGYKELQCAIDIAEAHRECYLTTEAEESAGAADDVRQRDLRYELQEPSFPDDFERFEWT